MEFIKDIATTVGCISAIIALMMVIFKPIRTKVFSYFASKAEKEKQEATMLDMQEKLSKSLDNDDKIIERLDKLETRQDGLETIVLNNEADRLKSEIYACGDRCRRKIPLLPEEFEHIRSTYRKYSEELGQNHDGELEWTFIFGYYNTQKLN